MVNSFIATFAILPASIELFLTILWLQLLWLWDLHNYDLEKIIKINKLSFSSIVQSHKNIFQRERLFFYNWDSTKDIHLHSKELFQLKAMFSYLRVPIIKTAIFTHDGGHRGASGEFKKRPQWKTTAKLCVSTLHWSTLQCGTVSWASSSLWTG